LLTKRKGNNEEEGNNNQVICCCHCFLHTREERGEQNYRGGSTKKQTQTKTKNKATKVYNNNEEGLFNLKKNTTMKNNVMTIIVTPTSYTQKKRKENKTARGNISKQMQTKTNRKITRTITRNHGFSKGST